MNFITDLHIHGRYAMACSKDLSIANLEKYGRLKGIDILGTGDFQHPKWREEINNHLKEEENGFLLTKSGFKFMWTTEISLIYTQDGKGRRVHLLVFAPNKECADAITKYLKSKGRLDYDGRPMFNISCIQFTEDLKAISKDIEIIPAHAWTPWFAVFGSKSGFNSLEQAFGDQAKHIHAIETGMSSDPAMNWMLSQLDNINLVSFSDAHSFWPWRLGREATIIDMKKASYKNIINAIRTGEGLKETVETPPEYGKYHVDGHRTCNISFEPEETAKHNGVCPKCKKPLTIGVLNRVLELADREEGYKPKGAAPFHSLIPLHEILSTLLKKNLATKTVWGYYNDITKNHNELDILLKLNKEELEKIAHPFLAKTILDLRHEKIQIQPGYDGEYGKLVLKDTQSIEKEKQKGLSSFK